MRTNSSKQTRLIDIANATGVSKTTVSKVLNKTKGNNTRVSVATAERIKKIADSYDYHPNLAARQLNGLKSNLIGVLVDSFAPENTHDQLAIIERYASEHGYRCIVGYSHGESDRIAAYVNDFKSRNVEGVVCISHNYPDNGAHLAKMFHTFKHRIFIEPPIDDDTSPYVATDHKKAAFLITNHLISIGRKRIAIMLPGIEYNQMRERKNGYQNALRKHNLKLDNALIWSKNTSINANKEEMKSVLKELLSATPDAIIAPGDGGAMWIIRILSSCGIKVPEEISVCGFGLWEISQSFLPSITTVDLRHREVAKKTIEILMDSFVYTATDSNEEQKVVIQPKMIIGESCHTNR